ncbi:hypothetical protein [Variovorax sp. Sphag1AA]|uniref:hypothetical protein n=1 Tax=Variovorax sp. Sphag1AA TaxID=2587027 RepID=UPI00160F7A87|nr:hypothetical protein [Variovorax sp. Sphag1AA]MBB3176785.1 hypothetical protein [Variovorax sp. Sphag1AA]
MVCSRLLLVVWLASWGVSAHAAVWRCTLRHVYEVKPGGALEPQKEDPILMHFQRVGEMLLYDEATGSVRYLSSGSTVWRLNFQVRQRGDDPNDSATALFIEPAGGSVIVLRIYTGNKEPRDANRFSFVDMRGSIGTGTCAQMPSG